MSPGQVDDRVIQRHVLALRQAVNGLRRHAGVTAAALRADRDRLWTIERGLQLAAQNALDIASHICSAIGQDATTYLAAIDGLFVAGCDYDDDGYDDDLGECYDEYDDDDDRDDD